MWVVSAANGVFYRENGAKEFKHVFIQESRENPIFFSALSSISEDAFGNIWLGSHMGGIAIYNLDTKRIEYYSEESPAPHSISGNSVKLVYKDSYNNI
jgi:ligand-binding sensor domain-containing protein